ncbi:DUF721 domain-containing protein [Petrachloros mirabilis]
MRTRGSLDSFGTILSGLAKRLGLESQLLERRLQHEWKDIVGDTIAANTWPDQIRFKKLYVTVRNSVWMQQLTFLKPELLTKLNDRAGGPLLTDITLRVGEVPKAVPPPETSTFAPTLVFPTTDVPADIQAHLSGIHDPAIRQKLTEVIATYTARVPPPAGSDPSPAP